MKKMILAVAAIAFGMTSAASACELDLNRVTASDLILKLGIPTQQAVLVIEHRYDHGPYESLDDLFDVEGLRGSVITQLREDAGVCVSTPKPELMP